MFNIFLPKTLTNPFLFARLINHFNPNVPLVSNIMRSKSIQDLFHLHQLHPHLFQLKHLALSSKLLMKFVSTHQKASQRVLSHQKFQIEKKEGWSILLQSVFRSNLQYATPEEICDLALLYSKIFYFQINIRDKFPQINVYFHSFRKKIQAYLKVDDNLNDFTMQQLISLLQALSRSMEQVTAIKILTGIKNLLEQQSNCTCFHLILIHDNIEYLRKKFKREIPIFQELYALYSKQLYSQILDAKPYVLEFNLMKIYKILRKSKSQKQLQFILTYIYDLIKYDKAKGAKAQSFDPRQIYSSFLLELQSNKERPDYFQKLIQIVQEKGGKKRVAVKLKQR